MKNLAHSACFDSVDKDAPSKPGIKHLKHDPEKCEAVFRKDHAQSKIQSAMPIHPNLIAR